MNRSRKSTESGRRSPLSGDRRRGRLYGRIGILERALWILAVVCLLPAVTAWAARTVISSGMPEAPSAKEVAMVNERAGDTSGPWSPPGAFPGLDTSPKALSEIGIQTTAPDWTEPDQALWSPQRRDAFSRLRDALMPPVTATLYLPRQGAVIPVFSGETEAHMTLGAAHLTDTAPLDGDGNIALTAHRDGAFRILREVAAGDPVVLQVDDRLRRFTVADTQIVEPDEVSVLAPSDTTSLTLITCYPFYFVGNAPQRFVLRAEADPNPETLLASATEARVTTHVGSGFSSQLNEEEYP